MSDRFAKLRAQAWDDLAAAWAAFTSAINKIPGFVDVDGEALEPESYSPELFDWVLGDLRTDVQMHDLPHAHEVSGLIALIHSIHAHVRLMDGADGECFARAETCRRLREEVERRAKTLVPRIAD